MRKVLFASTALVAFAGAAAADVAVTGSAKMGLFDNGTDDVQFLTDMDVTFKMSGETDNGLSFGAAIDIDEGGSGADAVANDSEDGGIAINVSGAFGTVTLGDTDGALDWAVSEVNLGGGSLKDDETDHDGFMANYGDGQGGDGQILRYDYSAGDFGVAISFESDESGAADYGYAIGLKYNLDLGGTTVGLGAGYQKAVSEEKITAVSAKVSMDSGLSIGVAYSDWSDSANQSTLGVGVGYSSGAITLGANYGKIENTGGDEDGFGLTANYDLGGGAVVKLGYGKDDTNSTASFGLALSF